MGWGGARVHARVGYQGARPPWKRYRGQHRVFGWTSIALPFPSSAPPLPCFTIVLPLGSSCVTYSGKVYKPAILLDEASVFSRRHPLRPVGPIVVIATSVACLQTSCPFPVLVLFPLSLPPLPTLPPSYRFIYNGFAGPSLLLAVVNVVLNRGTHRTC